MKEINEYKALIEDVSRVISSYANYKLWPPEIMREWNENTLLELHERVLRFNPADVKEAIIGDGKIDEFAGRLKTARFELDMKPTFAPTYYPAFDNDLFSNERNPEMYNALISINGKDWAFRVMDRLRLIAMIANTKIEDVCNTLDEIDVFINNKTAKATPGATANTDLSKLNDFSHMKSYTPTISFDMSALYSFLINEGVIHDVDEALFNDCISHAHVNELWRNGVISKLKLVIHHLQKEHYSQDWFNTLCQNLGMTKRQIGRFNVPKRREFEHRMMMLK